MHTPTSLSRALSRSKNVKGVPPAGVASGGVACLSSGDMQRLRLRVLDVALLSCGMRTCVCVVWPLATVPDAFAALDDASLASLGVVASELPHSSPASTPSKSKRARRRASNAKGSSDARESPRTPRDGHRKPRESSRMTLDSPHSGLERPGDSRERRSEGFPSRAASMENATDEPKKLIQICALPVEGDVVEATAVDVCADANVDFLWSEECVAMVHSALVGRILSPGMLIPISMLGKHIRLKVKSVRHPLILESTDGDVANEITALVFARFVSSSKLHLQDASSSVTDPTLPRLVDSIGGLDTQIQELVDLAQLALQEDLDANGGKGHDRLGVSWNCSQKSRGVLLHGPPGTGKTLVACAISEVCSVDVEVICGPEVLSNFSGEAVKTVEASFARAKRKRPCVVVLDEVDAMAPKRDAADADNVQRKLTATLLAILDGHNGSGVEGLFVIGTTNRPDAIDTAMRRAGRFDREIEIAVPDPKGRLQILQVLSAKASREDKLDMKNEELVKMARICYGFVGADLSALWRESVNLALRRGFSARVCYSDMLSALKLVKPSALREVAVEIPSTRWADIGGKGDAKQRLKEAVEWPLTDRGSALFASLGVSPPSGILLFGPPGCSKTLLARAVATESGANFISIKGAELLSKWVGESEKAVQAIFRRARQAAPCVVFFDEVDALAGSRSATRGASAQARVVAQLLSEMDGIDTVTEDPTRRVVVIAATNRPDCLDEAFLRPGRIDVQIYVGLPDEQERLAILKVHTRDIPLAENVDLIWMAGDKVTGGFSGAEIGALVREAALSAMECDVENASTVSTADFDRALQRVKPRTPAWIVEYFANYVDQVERRKSINCGSL